MERKITNHSCRRTAIQLLKNNGLSDSGLQSFSGHQSRESLADCCQTSDDQRILNTAMLIPFSSQELDLDEYDHYGYFKDFSEMDIDDKQDNN